MISALIVLMQVEATLIDSLLSSFAELGPVVTILGVATFFVVRYVVRSKDNEITRLHAIIEKRDERINALVDERIQSSERLAGLLDNATRLLETLRTDVSNRDLMDRLSELKTEVHDVLRQRA